MPKAADSFGDLIPGGFGAAPGPAAELQIEEAIPALSPITLEDKRRENFAKGKLYLLNYTNFPSLYTSDFNCDTKTEFLLYS